MSQYGNYKITGWERKSRPERTKRASFWIFGAAAIIILGIVLGLSGCKSKKVIVEKEKVVYQTKDSIVQRDSLVYVPYEVVKDYSLDTLVMQTSLAVSKSWLDTSTFYIVGELKNLKALEVKYIEVDKWYTKDSIVEKEKPVPYEVEVVKTKIPTVFWITFFICIGLLVYVGIRLYLRFKPL
jgi:hypothetical protein